MDLLHGQKLVLVQVLPIVLGVQILGEVHLNHFVHKGGRGVERPEVGVFPGAVAGLLVQLALRRVQSVLRLGIQLARRDFEQHARMRIAKLPLDKYIAVVKQGEHADCADMANHFADRLMPIRQADGVAVQVHDPAVIEQRRGQRFLREGRCRAFFLLHLPPHAPKRVCSAAMMRSAHSSGVRWSVDRQMS